MAKTGLSGRPGGRYRRLPLVYQWFSSIWP